MIFITEDAPHANAARLFVEFVLSDEGQKVLADNYYLPFSPNVPAKFSGLKLVAAGFRVVHISSELALDETVKWTVLYHDLFQ